MAAAVSPIASEPGRGFVPPPPSLGADLRRAEQAMQNAQNLRQSLEAQARASESLGLDLLHGYNYARAIDRDLREQCERMRQMTKAWQDQHPLRNALNGVFGEPPNLREWREREERMREEQEKAREKRGEFKTRALENEDQKVRLKEQLTQATAQEREASQRVEQLLKSLSAPERAALREQAREQTRMPVAQERA